MPKTYAEKLKDPRWQKKRLLILERAGWACESCEEKTKTLHVHHLYYRRNAEPWDYPDDALRCLCEDCHASDHAARDALKETLGMLTEEALVEMVHGYAAGILLREREGDGDRYELRSFEYACGFGSALPEIQIHPSRWWDMADQDSMVDGADIRQRIAASRREGA